MRQFSVVGRGLGGRDRRMHGQAEGQTLEHTHGQPNPYYLYLNVIVLAEIRISGCGVKPFEDNNKINPGLLWQQTLHYKNMPM